MTPGYTLHTTDTQPIETMGKWVKYKLFGSERYGTAFANEINWIRNGEKAPSEAGRIFEYKVINEQSTQNTPTRTRRV